MKPIQIPSENNILYFPLSFANFVIPYHFNLPPIEPENLDTRKNQFVDKRKSSQTLDDLSVDQQIPKSPQFQVEELRNSTRELEQKKIYKKNMGCPVKDCHKRYSSRIALRAHLRKIHPQWEEETSDYQP